MEKKFYFPVKSVFPSKKSLEKFLQGKNPVEGKYLIAANNTFEAFYNLENEQIELKVMGKTKKEMMEAVLKFWEIVDKIYRKPENVEYL